MEPRSALRLLERTSDLAAAAGSLDDAAEAILGELCAFVGWPVAHLRLVGAGTGEGEGDRAHAGWWHIDDPERFRVLRKVVVTTTASEPGSAGDEARSSGRPSISTELDSAAIQAGLGICLALPVIHAGEVIAVVEMLGDPGSQPVSDEVESLARATRQLGPVIDRRRVAGADQEHRRLLAATHDAYFRLDHDLTVTEWNNRAESTFGWPASEASRRSLADLISPTRFRGELVDVLHQARDQPGPVTVELIARHRSGSEFTAQLTAWSSGQGDGLVSGVVVETGGQSRLEGQLARQALHDRLTGLPNRALFRDRLDHALARALRVGSNVAVLLFDLDRFKVVNDSLGPDGGDRLLVAVSGRLAEIERPGDTIARLGGDEYGLLCEEVDGPDEAAEVAQRVLDLFSRPFRIGEHEVTVTASVGVAVATGESPFSSAQGDLLMRDADVAMYRAKQQGRGRFEIFLEAMRTEAVSRLSMENDLRHAIRQGQLRLFYQPIVRLDTARAVGFEALVRWEHPTRGLLSPADFIPPAEETGLIIPLGRLVLAEATLQAAAWQRRRDPNEEPLRMSVNVSARQLSQPGWVDEVADLLAASSLEPGLLVLEITESVLMDDIEASIERLEELRRLGVRVAIDDFGTGYSSLGYLRRLPVDILKIDKTFIDGVAEGPHESALARAVIKLASTLGLDAVAEGVSDRKQLTKLVRLRCPYGQGYYFSHPVPTDEAAGLLDLPSLPA